MPAFARRNFTPVRSRVLELELGVEENMYILAAVSKQYWELRASVIHGIVKTLE